MMVHTATSGACWGLTPMSKPRLAEADMLRDDWNRSHDLTLVAQLHACTPQDVIDALGLTEEEIPARYRHHTQPNGKHWGRAPGRKPTLMKRSACMP